MKAVRFTLILFSFSLLLASCSLFRSNKRGCPAGGVGAEKYMDGSKLPKQKKFKG
jgi:hypothetical protein